MRYALLLFIMAVGYPAAHSAGPHWVGTAPACGASCADCSGKTPVCMDSSRTKAGINATRFKSGFGYDCSSGKKVLCGPKGSAISPHWIGSAPFCKGSCEDCTGNTPICMETASDKGSIELIAYKNRFGGKCSLGEKVLCGPKGSPVVPRWVGTAPACEASAKDCTVQTGSTHFLDISDSKSNVNNHAYESRFGKDCGTGRKVLCVPPATSNSLQSPGRWIGTAPLCAARPSDCPAGLAYLESASSVTEASYRGFGQPCDVGKKVYCGNRSGEPPMTQKGYANLPTDPADGCANGCKIAQFMIGGKDKIDARAICNEHDRCYATFGTSKSDCDSDFLGAMIDACRKDGNQDCEAQAAAYFIGVSVGAESQFNKSQRRARKHIVANPAQPGQVFTQVIGGYWGGGDYAVYPKSCASCSDDSQCKEACPKTGTSTPVCKSKHCLCAEIKPPTAPTGFKILR